MKKPTPLPTPPSSKADFDALGGSLEKLSSNPGMAAQLAEAERDHPYWEKFRHRTASMGIDPKHLWYFVKSQRRITAKPIELTKDPDFRFSFNLTGNMQKTLHRLDMKLGGTIGGTTTIPEGTREQVLLSSLMEEAIASSLLEGAATTREIAKEMLRAGRSPKDRSERMVLNNYLTMQRLVGWSKENMTVDRLLEIHRSVTGGTLEHAASEGRVRTNNDVHVVDGYNEVLHFPPSHERLSTLLEALCAFANHTANEPFIHPVVRGITLHFLVGYIHPFVDGNGRTARALFYWYMLRSGYWLVEFLAISKIILRAPAQYGRAYLHTEMDGNDLTYFLDFNLRSLHLAMEDLDLYLHGKLDERRRLFSIVRNTSINDRQADIVSLWLREPEKVLTIAEVKTRFNVVYQTARTDLMGLEAMKLAMHRKSGKALRYFRSREFEAELGKLGRGAK